jgi:hypothetical protein
MPHVGVQSFPARQRQKHRAQDGERHLGVAHEQRNAVARVNRGQHFRMLGNGACAGDGQHQNHRIMMGPNKRATRSVPRRCKANKAVSTTSVTGTVQCSSWD